MCKWGKEIQKIIPYKPIVDAAIHEAYFKPQNCVVLQREFVKCDMNPVTISIGKHFVPQHNQQRVCQWRRGIHCISYTLPAPRSTQRHR